MAKQRGRKTVGALEAVQSIPERPKPPADLGNRQKEIWLEVTKGLPVEWFGDETLGLLRDYCEHQVMFERMSKYLNDNFDDLEVDELAKLAKSREVESRAAISLATKMRITQQASYDKSKTKSPGAGRAPWGNVNNN